MAIRPLVHKVRVLAGARGAKDLFWAFQGGWRPIFGLFREPEAYFGPFQEDQRPI